MTSDLDGLLQFAFNRPPGVQAAAECERACMRGMPALSVSPVRYIYFQPVCAQTEALQKEWSGRAELKAPCEPRIVA